MIATGSTMAAMIFRPLAWRALPARHGSESDAAWGAAPVRPGLQELQWRHDDVGGAVAVGAFELQHDLAGAVALEPLVGNGGAGNVAAQAFELLALVGATAYCRV